MLVRSIRFHNRARQARSMRSNRSDPSCQLAGSSLRCQTDLCTPHRSRIGEMRRNSYCSAGLVGEVEQVLANSKRIVVDRDLLTCRTTAPHVRQSSVLLFQCRDRERARHGLITAPLFRELDFKKSDASFCARSKSDRVVDCVAVVFFAVDASASSSGPAVLSWHR